MATPRWQESVPVLQTSDVNQNAVCIGDSIWFSTMHPWGAKGMIEFIMETNQKSITKYPAHITPGRHNCCALGEIIYIIDPEQNNIIAFDTRSKTFEKKVDLQPEIADWPAVCLLNKTIHIIGAVADGNTMKHLAYDIEQNRIRVIDQHLGNEQCSLIQLVSVDDRIMRLGGINWTSIMKPMNAVWTSSTIENTHNNYISWRAMSKLPVGMYSFGIVRVASMIIVFGGCLFFGAAYSDEIYTFDLRNPNGGWTESAIKCPLKSAYIAVLDSDQNVHLFSTDNAILGFASKFAAVGKVVDGSSNPTGEALQHFVLPVSRIIGVQPQQQLQQQQPQPNDEEKESKCADCDNLRQQMSVIEAEKLSLQTLVNELLEQKSASDDLNADKLNALRQENASVKAQICALRQEIERLRRPQHLDENEFMTWSPDQVVDWLCSLQNGAYRKYETVLRREFNKDGVTGASLHLLNSTELRFMGIVTLADRAAVCEHIQNLINHRQNHNHSNNNNNQNNDDEGKNIGPTAYHYH